MKILILFMALLLAGDAGAQVTAVSIQASGLTCSMCSNAIRKSLESLEYVDQVKANIKKSSFEVSFKPGAAVRFDDLKAKVEDAGFFVADFRATASVSDLQLRNDRHAEIAGMAVHVLNAKDQVKKGSFSFRVVDKGYVGSKEFRKNAQWTAKACYQTGIAGSCCAEDNLRPGTRVYHITF